MNSSVTAVSSNGVYSFTKPNRDSVTLLAGLGVEGDVHAGVTVKHRSRVAQDPTQPNLRQVRRLRRPAGSVAVPRAVVRIAGADLARPYGC
ncbi:hypothetical protein ACFTXO_29520, partial [Streptomyces sp. NPDC057067]